MAEQDIRTGSDKVAILAAICMAALVLPLSFSGGAVATPAIGRELGGGPAALAWVTNAFMLTFGSALMAAGTLADRFGRKRAFAIGLAAFTASSLAIGMASTVIAVDVLRAAQGLAAAATLAGGSAALAQEFEGQARTRAYGLLGTTFGVGLAFGPLLAGFLVETTGWRSAMLASAVVGALAFLFGVPRMQESRDPGAAGIDVPGILSFTAMLVLFTFGVIRGPEKGWMQADVMTLLAGALAALVAFIVVEARSARPMLDLSLFRYPRFVGVQLLPVATCYCYVVLLVLLPLRFIGIEGRNAIDAGLLMLALSAPMLVVPMLAAVLMRWFPAGVLSGAGLVIAALGLVMLGGVDPVRGGIAAVLPMLVIGIGAGMPWGLMDGLAVSVVPKERAGMAIGIFSTTRVAGEGVALAIVSAALAALIDARLHGIATGAGAESAKAAAQLVAMGGLERALALLPGFDRALLVKIYADAFRILLWILAAMTFVSAVIVFWLLGTGRGSIQSHDGVPDVEPAAASSARAAIS